MSQAVKLEVKGITKTFPGVKALDNVSFSVKKGTVHVLCGENGAGKSTLMKIINGIYKPDSGEIVIDGKPVNVKNPIDARKHGISMIFQELNYIPEMTIEESFFVGSWPVDSIKKVDWKSIKKKTDDLLKREGLAYNSKTKLKDLSVSDVQMLEILKAISYDSDIIIMDEPTSAITNKEVRTLFGKIKELKERGACIIYISHKMEEIFEIADEITVFRDGKVIDSRPVEAYDLNLVISQMVGREISDSYPKQDLEIGETALEVKNLSSKGSFKDVNFAVKRGEIIGFAGLMGAGRTEVMRALFGLDKYDSGEILINNVPVRIHSPQDSVKHKIAMLSEDRRRFGIVPVRSVKENASLSNLNRFIYKGRLHKSEENAVIGEYFKKMNVKTPTMDTTIDVLSGGNQQKVILAKWMVTDPDILILDEPTRGIDVGAKYEIYELITKLASEGRALILISSELPELIGMCDRVYVMSKGQIKGELSAGDITQEKIMYLATQN